MTDASLVWGGDLGVSPTGDVATTDGSMLGQQRVLRRLLTNPLDYTWEPSYGAGLGSFVGQTAGARAIAGVIRSQLLLEAAVARQPSPEITSQTTPDGSVFVDMVYADAASTAAQALTFSIGV